jgi:hypothetical protein
MLGFSYNGPRAMLYRGVCLTGVISGVLIALGPVVGLITPNDLSSGLSQLAIVEFAAGLGVLATLLFLVLLFFRDVSRQVKLLALAAVIFPYMVIAILRLLAAFQTPPVA